MKGERLFRILGLIDADLIEEAGTASSPAAVQRRHTARRRWLAAAACVALAVTLTWSTGLFSRLGASMTDGSTAESGGSGIATDNEPLHVDGTTFMSYAGPVFPLTLAEKTEGLTAERHTTWDFTAGSYADGSSRQWGATVTDSYVLVNHTSGDITAVTYYPFAGAFTELASQCPTVTVDGGETEAALYAGSYAGGFRNAGVDDGSTWNLEYPDSWTDYRALLEDGGYLEAALGAAPALDIPVTVYEFTDFEAPHEEYDAATQAVEFTIDPEETNILTYGFNGASWDENTGWRQYSYLVPNGQRRDTAPKLLVVLGEDIGDYTLQGYEDGGCDRGEELEGVGCTVTRRETTLDGILDGLCQNYLKTYVDWQYGMTDSEAAAVPCALFRRAVNELLTQYGPLAGGGTADRDAGGRLDSIISETMSQRRVLYLAVPVTLPAGSEVNITFTLWKEPSFDYGCSGSENVGLQGYDFVTRLGSTLDFTSQTASLTKADSIEVTSQNFGFHLENDVTEVTLDLAQEHYYLEIRPKT